MLVIRGSWPLNCSLQLWCTAWHALRLADSASIGLPAAMAAILTCSAFGECLSQVAECAAMTAALVLVWLQATSCSGAVSKCFKYLVWLTNLPQSASTLLELDTSGLRGVALQVFWELAS